MSDRDSDGATATETKAVVLAAGEGRRLRPLTERRPKPMLPVANMPVLEYVVRALADAGVRDIVLVVGYRRERIQSYFGDGDDWGVGIEYVVQEKQLGTGHALLQAEGLVDGDFLVLNGDSVTEASVVSDMLDEDGTAMAVTRADEPSDYGVVELDGDSVARIVEKPEAGYDADRDTVNAGVYRLDGAVFDEVRSEGDGVGEMSLVDALVRRAERGEVTAVRSGGWADVSHLWDLVSLNARKVDGDREGATVHETAHVSEDAVLGEDARVGPNAAVLPGTSIGDNAVVDAGAVVENTVVFADARVREGAVVRDSVVAEDVHVGANATVEGGDADVVVEGELHEDVRLGGVVGDGSWLQGGAQLRPGAVLGNGVTVGTGATVGGRVPPGTEVR